MNIRQEIQLEYANTRADIYNGNFSRRPIGRRHDPVHKDEKDHTRQLAKELAKYGIMVKPNELQP